MFVLVSFVAVQGFRTFRKAIRKLQPTIMNPAYLSKTNKIILYLGLLPPDICRMASAQPAPIPIKLANPNLHTVKLPLAGFADRAGFVITITDKSEIDRIISSLEFKIKEPCRCLHDNYLTLYSGNRETMLDFCDHCLSYCYMPKKFWELYTEYHYEILQSEAGLDDGEMTILKKAYASLKYDPASFPFIHTEVELPGWKPDSGMAISIWFDVYNESGRCGSAAFYILDPSYTGQPDPDFKQKPGVPAKDIPETIGTWHGRRVLWTSPVTTGDTTIQKILDLLGATPTRK